MKTGPVYRQALSIAIPVMLQAILQSSFGLVDQILVGQLGDAAVAAVGVAGKIAGLHMTLMMAVAAGAAIMFAQYAGAGDSGSLKRSLQVNTYFSLMIYALFALPSFCFSDWMIGIFSSDADIVPDAAGYLRIVMAGHLPFVGTSLLSAFFRNTGKAALPMGSGFLSAALDTLFSYLLIYGKLGLPAMGVAGAALATVLGRVVEFGLLTAFYLRVRTKEKAYAQKPLYFYAAQGFKILMPVLLGEAVWGVGEAAYGAIYGRMGIAQMAAMTLTMPLQSVSFAAFSGLSVAAGVLAGERLGRREVHEAYRVSETMLRFGTLAALAVGGALALLAPRYAQVFQVSAETAGYAQKILWMYGIVLWIKIYNYILTCGILPSGGETKYGLYLNIIGPWGWGVPAGFLTAFVLKMPVHWVYFILSLEEALRMILGARIFHKKHWLRSIT